MTKWVMVPLEPTEEQWGGLARAIIMWTRLNDGLQIGSELHEHLRNLGWAIPDWLPREIPDTDRTPPKGAVAVCIYRAMLAAAPDPWQPAETAPRDGTPIWAWVEPFGGFEAVAWQETGLRLWRTKDGRHYEDAAVTAWMPLPEPPT